jgi:hypothetical protein
VRSRSVCFCRADFQALSSAFVKILRANDRGREIGPISGIVATNAQISLPRIHSRALA